MNKKQLYESIMRNVSYEVKKALNESVFDDFINKTKKYIGDNFSQKLAFKDITIILDDDSEVLFEDLTDDMNPVFIKISTRRTEKDDADIIISIFNNHYESNGLAWSKENAPLMNEDNSDYELDGYANSEQIMDNADRMDIDVPAARYAMNLRIGEYMGYLPSIGQLEILRDYTEVVNSILSELGGKPININKSYWSSSEQDHRAYGLYQGGKYLLAKHNTCAVLPMFKY